MASSSHQRIPKHKVDKRLENLLYIVEPRHNSGIPSAHDVSVPLQLLQATGNIGSFRDRDGSRTWAPQPSLPSENRVGSLTRPETRASSFPNRATALLNRDEGLCLSNRQQDKFTKIRWKDEKENGSKPHRQLSYIPESDDVLSTTPNAIRPATRDSSTPGSSIWSTTDPFSTSNNSVNITPAQTLPRDHRLTISGRQQVVDPEVANNTHRAQNRRGTLQSIVDSIVPDVIQRRFTNASHIRKSSMWQTYEKAKERSVQLQRNRYIQLAFEYSIYLILVLFVYFVLIGVPLWKGAVYWLWWVVAHKFVITGGFSITLGIALFYAFAPLLIFFEKDPPSTEKFAETKAQPNVRDTALLIPCYKSASLIAATLEAALKIFPPSHIFVIANGNSPTPLDNTEEVCRPFKVNHIWSPIGSKIVAQFVGCYAAKSFKNILLIDDDCALPEDFPVVTERLVGNVRCIGYTIKSVGPNSSRGNLCQQAQDLEYKLSGIQREFAGLVGSATFPHGAISLWDRQLLVKTFHEHPGFSVSEDWFFGHVARKLGCRIKMCSHVFVETETPTAVFFSSGGSRGGFGEMTIFKQRFKRWNFFFVNGMWYNMTYVFGSWKLGWWEIGAKIFVFQEIYETLLYLLTPFILPISFYVRPSFCGILLGATIIMYLINVVIFNEIHLRRKNERLGWVLLYVYYLPYKIVLTGINVASCYWSLWKYARYFAKRHPKVIEDEKAVEVIIRLEEEAVSTQTGPGRRMTVRTIASRSPPGLDDDKEAISPMQRADTGMYGVVTEPQLAHAKMNTSTMNREGIATMDYFFEHHNPNGGYGLEKSKNKQVQRKKSFGAWCRG